MSKGQAWGAPSRPGRTYRACRSLVGPSGMNPTLKNPINIENPETKPRTSTPLLQASVLPRSHLEGLSGTLPEGEIITGGHLHHPGGQHDEEGVVHPRG
jgi:hypothetical protein